MFDRMSDHSTAVTRWMGLLINAVRKLVERLHAEAALRDHGLWPSQAQRRMPLNQEFNEMVEIAWHHLYPALVADDAKRIASPGRASVTQLGLVAGEVLNVLEADGDTRLETLLEEINAPIVEILMALGWLIREGLAAWTVREGDVIVTPRLGGRAPRGALTSRA